MGRITSLQNDIANLQKKLEKNNRDIAAQKKRESAIKAELAKRGGETPATPDAVLDSITKLVA